MSNGRGGRYQAPAGGRGRMGGPEAAGPGGFCVCTKPGCDYKQPHKLGTPCDKFRCPKCGAKLTRKPAR